MKISAGGILWCKKPRFQFKGNYDVYVDEVVKTILKWMVFLVIVFAGLGLWKAWELLELLQGLVKGWI